MEWFRVGGTPGGYLIQTLAPSRANFKARSCFLNKLFLRSFREGLSAKPIISHVSSHTFRLMTKSKQHWSPRCNLWQMMVNKAITLTLDLPYVTGIKNEVKKNLGTMSICPFKFFRSFHYQQTCQTCSQKGLIYPCTSGSQLPPRQLSMGALQTWDLRPHTLPLTVTLFSLIRTDVLHNTFFFSITVCFFNPGQLQGWARATLKAVSLWYSIKGSRVRHYQLMLSVQALLGPLVLTCHSPVL